jgi:hypothetical protein
VVTFNSRNRNSKDAPRCKRFTATSGYITSFFNSPFISMSSSCGSFNRSQVSQKSLMHPSRDGVAKFRQRDALHQTAFLGQKGGIYPDRASMHLKLHIFEAQLAGRT